MNYRVDQVTLDFARRTLKNLEFIEAHAAEAQGEVYEFTQLVNSLLGLLVFPEQRFYASLPLTPLGQEGWPAIHPLFGADKTRTAKELLRYLRNGVAHHHIIFLSQQGNLCAVLIWNIPFRSSSPDWIARLSLEEVKILVRRVVEMVEKLSASQQAEEIEPAQDARAVILSRARRMRREPTPTEAAMWSRLRARRLGGYKFRRQHPIDPYIVDFYCAEAGLVVEIDGDIHARQVEYDQARTAWLEEKGLRVIRYTNAEVEHNLTGVLEDILRQLQASSLPFANRDPRGASSPSPRWGEDR